MTTRRTYLAAATLLSLAMTLTTVGVNADATTKKKTAAKTKTPPTTKVVIANGKPCSTKGAQATAGAAFECVQLISDALQWWQAGTIRNPIKVGVPVRVASDISGNWELTVVRRVDDDTARLLAADPRNALVNPPATISTVWMTIKNTGTTENRTRVIGYTGVSRKRDQVERWVPGELLVEDCWNNEAVQPGATKSCSFPYELKTEEIPQLRLGLLVSFATSSSVYMNTGTDQPPLR